MINMGLFNITRWKGVFPRKNGCHFCYRLRGNGPKETKWAIKHKTEFGLFVLNLRNFK